MKYSRQFVIKHSIPNRIRFVIPAIRWNTSLQEKLYNSLDTEQGINWIQVKPKSSSLIVRYQNKIITEKAIISLLEQLFNYQKPQKKQGKEKSNKSTSISFIGLSAYTVGILIRQNFFKLSVAQNFFSPTGLVVTLFALPLLRKGLGSIRQKKVSLESFLGGSIVIASVAGESLAALEILWITHASNLLNKWVNDRSRLAIRDILQVTTKNTYILVDNVEIETAVEQVNPGDTVVLHTGEKISIDGKIIQGEALVDEAVINGRPESIVRKLDDRVFAGTFVRQGVIYVEAEKVGDKTYLSRIIEMVENSLDNKADVQGVADQLAENLIKLGFIFTAGTWLITGSLQRAFTVMLVMSCPCATILAASTAISAALSAAAKNHILIKGGRYLEEVGRAETVYFDKTGTLTENLPQIEKIHNYSDQKTARLLQLAYSAEMHNSHPLALAIKNESERRNLEPITHHVCEYILGKGVRSEIENSEVLVGSKKLLDHFSLSTKNEARHVKQKIKKYEKDGMTVIYIVQDKLLLGIMSFSYQERSKAQGIIDSLRDDGVKKIGMITGDEAESAFRLSGKLGLSPCIPSVMPDEKAEIIKKAKNDGKVIMVGDGINDALALAEADIGIVMGAGGSDVAIEAADIALIKDDLDGIPFVRSLSRSTMEIINQNFWIATGSNIGGVALGALGLLTPTFAGLLHIVHTLGVLANSSRLLLVNPDEYNKSETVENSISID